MIGVRKLTITVRIRFRPVMSLRFYRNGRSSFNFCYCFKVLLFTEEIKMVLSVSKQICALINIKYMLLKLYGTLNLSLFFIESVFDFSKSDRFTYMFIYFYLLRKLKKVKQIESLITCCIYFFLPKAGRPSPCFFFSQFFYTC